jgi:cytochrome b involved in lipid metabolism
MTKQKIIIGAAILTALAAVIWFFAARRTPAPALAPTGALTFQGDGQRPVRAPSASERIFTAADVSAHSDASSCYSSVSGSVYDLTSWISRHSGGSGAILKICGRDATNAFISQHGGQEKAETALAGFKIGSLAK